MNQKLFYFRTIFRLKKRQISLKHELKKALRDSRKNRKRYEKVLKRIARKS